MIDTEESPHIPAYDLNIVAESKRQASLSTEWSSTHVDGCPHIRCRL